MRYLYQTKAMMLPLRPLLLFGLYLVPIVLGKDGLSGIPLKLTVDGISGNYTIQVGQAEGTSGRKTLDDGTFTTWLWSAETRLGDWNSADGTLVVSGVEKGTGSDVFGPYDVITIRWNSLDGQGTNDDEKFLWHTSFRTYKNDPSMIVLEQYFPNRLETKPFSKRSNHLAAISLFPSFQRGPPTTSELACFSYHEIFAQMKYCHLADYEETILGGSPLVMYNETDSTLPTLILSPLNWPMAHQMASSSTMFGAGIKANVTEIPAGWSQQFLLSASNGMSNAFLDWGDRMFMMKKKGGVEHGSGGVASAGEVVDPTSPTPNHNNHLRRTGPFPAHAKQEQRPDNMYRDPTHSTIGFWTDNGGYYHYNTGFENGTYEDVLPKVKAYHER
jgi:hypothetical protein